MIPEEEKNQVENDVLRGISAFFRLIGDNPDRPGLAETPNRVLRSYQELFAGYQEDPEKVLAKNFQDETIRYNGIILMDSIDFVSFCQHHLLPFEGVAHVAYLAHDHLVGASKLARIVDIFARRLQIQEMMTTQIADAIQEHVSDDLAVIIQAHHSCMSCRGVRKARTMMKTSEMRGAFKTDPATREELFHLIQLGNPSALI